MLHTEQEEKMPEHGSEHAVAVEAAAADVRTAVWPVIEFVAGVHDDVERFSESAAKFSRLRVDVGHELIRLLFRETARPSPRPGPHLRMLGGPRLDESTQ